jgi:hypothetical protein
MCKLQAHLYAKYLILECYFWKSQNQLQICLDNTIYTKGTKILKDICYSHPYFSLLSSGQYYIVNWWIYWFK